MRLSSMVVVIGLAVVIFIPTSSAQEGGGTMANCAPTFTVSAVGGLLSSGPINFCLYAPGVVHGSASAASDDVVRISAVVVGPSATSAVFTYQTTIVSGCSIGGMTQSDTIGTFGSMSTANWNIDINDGANQCTGIVRVTITAGLISTQVYRAEIPYMIQTEATEIDNLVRLCAASAWNTTCNTNEIAVATDNFTDALCRPTGNHGHCELDLHGEIGVDILNDATDDDVLTVPPASISNVSVNGTFPSELTVHADFPGDGENLGLDAWTTALFWIAAVLFFAYMGWLVALGFAIPGLMAAMVPSVKAILDGLGLDFEALFMLCFLGFILEIVANRLTWGGYQSGKRRLRFGA